MADSIDSFGLTRTYRAKLPKRSVLGNRKFPCLMNWQLLLECYSRNEFESSVCAKQLAAFRECEQKARLARSSIASLNYNLAKVLGKKRR